MNREQDFVSRIQADRLSRQGRLRYLVVVPGVAPPHAVWRGIIGALRATGVPQLLPLSIVGFEVRLDGDIIVQLHGEKANMQPISGRQFHGVWFWAMPADAAVIDRCIDRLAPGGWVKP